METKIPPTIDIVIFKGPVELYKAEWVAFRSNVCPLIGGFQQRHFGETTVETYAFLDRPFTTLRMNHSLRYNYDLKY